MRARDAIWVGACFVICLVAVAIPYFRAPYNSVDFSDLFGFGAMLVAALSVVLTAVVRVPAWLVAPVMSAVLPAVVLARVAVDVAADPTSHNLWPFELLLALIPGLVFGVGGALAGVALRRFVFDRRPGFDERAEHRG